MEFISTRNARLAVSGAQAVVEGLSKEGGLFVPAFFPRVSESELKALESLDFPALSAAIISKFLPELNDIESYTKKAYSRFDGEVAPLVKLDEGEFVLELWHGPTHAFKDVALTLLPHLLNGSKKLLGHSERTMILVATSGDTGKAALEGFCNTDGADVVVLYPSDGVSELQKLQMMTQRGGNVGVFGIKGNFDDAQNAVKRIFTDKQAAITLAKYGYALSSANSINFGRLVPQIAYYFSAYLNLVSSGEILLGDEVNFCVPSGNFGNILAGYYAKRMGLPVGRLICASNMNNVLTDFFNSGEYSTHREFYKTTSPSMDILISSNLERLVFELSNRDDALIAARMEELKNTGAYSITEKECDALSAEFWADWADEHEVADTIEEYFDEFGYIVDPHTAVALSVKQKYHDAVVDDRVTVVLSTASPYKFASDVLAALGERGGNDMDALIELEALTALPLPDTLAELPKLKKLHTDIIEREETLGAVLAFAERHAKQ